MMKNDPARHNLIRRRILDILAPEYPKTVDGIILQRVLANFGHPMDTEKLKSYLAYLEERRCVTVKEVKDTDIFMAAITADGLDVIDGRKNERGIEI